MPLETNYQCYRLKVINHGYRQLWSIVLSQTGPEVLRDLGRAK